MGYCQQRTETTPWQLRLLAIATTAPVPIYVPFNQKPTAHDSTNHVRQYFQIHSYSLAFPPPVTTFIHNKTSSYVILCFFFLPNPSSLSWYFRGHARVKTCRRYKLATCPPHGTRPRTVDLVSLVGLSSSGKKTSNWASKTYMKNETSVKRTRTRQRTERDGSWLTRDSRSPDLGMR